MALLEEMDALGANTKEGLERVVNDRDLYVMMLGMFVDSLQSDPVCTEAFDSADLDGLIRRVHSLKGTAGNLSLTPLFEGYTEILNLLREQQPAAAKAVWLRLAPKQQEFVDCIARSRGLA